MSVAKASTVAEPVVRVNHHTRANCTNWLPKRENACPIQMTQNGFMDCMIDAPCNGLQ